MLFSPEPFARALLAALTWAGWTAGEPAWLLPRLPSIGKAGSHRFASASGWGGYLLQPPSAPPMALQMDSPHLTEEETEAQRGCSE